MESLEGRIDSVEKKIDSLDRRIGALERRMDVFALFSGSLLGVLTGRNLIDQSSAGFLASILSFGVSGGKSKYYTQKDYEKLKSIVAKRIDEITSNDVRELKRIIELIEKRYMRLVTLN